VASVVVMSLYVVRGRFYFIIIINRAIVGGVYQKGGRKMQTATDRPTRPDPTTTSEPEMRFKTHRYSVAFSRRSVGQ